MDLNRESKTCSNKIHHQLSNEKLEELSQWLDKFVLSRPHQKKLAREFADAILLAEILKVLYPKLVELHNYSPQNSFQLKMDNWCTLNRKVLHRLGFELDFKTMETLAKGASGAIEVLLFKIMNRYTMECNKNVVESSSESMHDNDNGEYFKRFCRTSK